MTKSHHLADSVTINSMNDQLVEVEKKYDTQKAELEKALLNSRFKVTLLTLIMLVFAAIGLVSLLLRYRSRLRMQQAEYEMMKSELDQSITSLQQMQVMLDERQTSQKQSGELKAIVDSQIQVVHQLLQWSYECNETTFAKRFNRLMTMRGPDEVGSSYWDNLQALANEMYDNVLVKAQEAAGGTLREDEINMIALHCHGFSRTVIMICMRYTNLRTVSNKRTQIAHKLHVATLDEFLKPFLKVRSEE
jgi:ABC-type multidrug transport system fused ATPase/permease subunit